MPPLPHPVPPLRFMHGRIEQFGFGPGSGHGLLRLVVFVVVAALVLLVVALLTRGRSHPYSHSVAGATAPVNEAVRILDERFARGDVDVDDYKVRRELLISHA